MPRTARLIPPEGCLHVICRGNNQQTIFQSDQDFRFYYDLLLQLKEENSIEIYHYCLMNNHVHLIISLHKNSTLARYMKQVNLSYFHYFKRQNKYSGHLWQGRFKNSIIENDSYLLQCGKYIELNPVRAAIVKRPEDYPYSSYKYYAYGKEDKLLMKNILYNSLGKSMEQKQEEYRRFVMGSDIKQRLGTERFVGTPAFVKHMEEYFSVKNTNLKKGRPAKKK